ncbi:MAG: DUF6492 family protein, partial [Reyranella sp.]
RQDFERAGLLMESLSRHWCDPSPFQIHVVAPAGDVDTLRASLPRFANIDVSVRSERDFFPLASGFHLMPGWYRQQIVKLAVPAQLGFGAYLTLDSDVCCVGDFDAATFIAGGRLLSRWEPKEHHAWWRRAADVVGMPHDDASHGLSVTPNILHGDLAAQTLAHFRDRPLGALPSLASRIYLRFGATAWTEYSLYTCVGQLRGNLFDHHVHWETYYGSSVRLFSEHTCIWSAEDFERLASRPAGGDPGGKFIIVQSRARVPLERVRAYCLGFSG